MQTSRLRPLPKGTAFVRAVGALALARGRPYEAEVIAERWRDTPGTVLCLRSAVASGTTSETNWASPLAQPDAAAAEFAEILRDGSIAGRMAGLRRVPRNISYPAQTSASSVGWVAEGAPASVSRLQFETNSLGIAKCAGIVVITKELAQLSNPDGETLLRNDLTKSAIEFLDAQFIDPSVAAVANQNPASITNGITARQSTGSTATQIAADLAAVAETLADANEMDAPVWIMTRATAVLLAAKRDTAGGAAFPGVTAAGGSLLGIPVITSNAVPHSVSAGSIIVLVNAAGIDYADLPTLELGVSTQASLQMSDAPSAGAQQLVSLWQNNLIAVRLVAFRNYRRVRSSAVAYIDNVHI